jgi:hypothetical protein
MEKVGIVSLFSELLQNAELVPPTCKIHDGKFKIEAVSRVSWALSACDEPTPRDVTEGGELRHDQTLSFTAVAKLTRLRGRLRRRELCP